MTGRWFSLVSSTNKTDRHDITEILLNVTLNAINQTIKMNKIILIKSPKQSLGDLLFLLRFLLLFLFLFLFLLFIIHILSFREA